MARKCRCKICGTTLTVDKAYKVTVGGKNKYYCSEQEYNEYVFEANEKERCYDVITDMLNTVLLTPNQKRMINDIRRYYSYEVIIRTFKSCEKNIRWFVENKADSMTSFNADKYLVTIILNEINRVNKEYLDEQKAIEELFKKEAKYDDVVDVSNREVKRSDAPDISEWLD